MRVLLTGATGFIGSHLIGPLSQRHEVIALVRELPKAAGEAQADFVQADFSRPDFVRSLPAKADAIVHLAQAANSFPENAGEMCQVNLGATQVLADYARRAGVQRFVYASTGNVYQRSASAYAEQSALKAESFYEFTKLASENLLELYVSWFNLCTLRLFTPYGPGQRDRMLTKIADLVRQKQPVVLNNGGKPFVSPIYIDDLVPVFLQATERNTPITANVGGDETISVKAIAEQAAEFFGQAPIFQINENEIDWNLICNNRLMKAEFELGALLPFQEGYNAYLESRETG